jgi:hypothetical protein
MRLCKGVILSQSGVVNSSCEDTADELSRGWGRLSTGEALYCEQLNQNPRRTGWAPYNVPKRAENCFTELGIRWISVIPKAQRQAEIKWQEIFKCNLNPNNLAKWTRVERDTEVTITQLLHRHFWHKSDETVYCCLLSASQFATTCSFNYLSPFQHLIKPKKYTFIGLLFQNKECRATSVHKGRIGTGLLILNLDEGMVSITPRPLYTRERNPVPV